MPRTPMPSPKGTNHAGLFLPWPTNPAAAYDSMSRAARIARDQSLDSDDVLSLFKILLSGIAPEERADFKAKLQDLLDAGSTAEPTVDEPPPFPGRPRPGGSMDRLAHDARPPRGMPSFAERFPNASKVRGEGGSRRTYTAF